MARITWKYDKAADVLYVRKRLAGTLNIPLTPDETLCVDPRGPEVVGCIYENLSVNHPKIYRAFVEGPTSYKQLVMEFFELLINDWNSFLSPFRSKKALLDFLKSERRHSVGRSASPVA